MNDEIQSLNYPLHLLSFCPEDFYLQSHSILHLCNADWRKLTEI